MTEVKKVKASERLAALESSVVSVDKLATNTAKRSGELELIVFNLSRENEILKDALQLVYEKLDGVVGLISAKKELTDKNINEQIVLQKERGLADKVKQSVDAGQLSETSVVSNNSFVVARELSKETGEVENPRLQFLVSKIVEELQNKFLDKKVGDLVKGEDGKFDIEIMEIYDLVEQPLAEIPAEEESEAEETEKE